MEKSMETIGDQYNLACPWCGKPSFDNAWDGHALQDGDDWENECNSCGKSVRISVDVQITVTAETIEPGGER